MTTWRSSLPQALLIAAAALWVYSPAFFGGFVWDDVWYLNADPLIHDPAGFWKVWLHTDGQYDYYPLTALARWVQWHLWGDATLGYHLVSVGLHLASAFLLWRLFSRLGLPRAWVGGLLFAVHPVMVESVAWISELKNTLSLPPLLCAMLAWLDWKERGDSRFHRAALLWFGVSLLAKSAGSMLPFVLLGYAGWKNGRITRDDFRSVAPFFGVALVAGFVTLLAHAHVSDPEKLQPNWHLGTALACVGWSAAFLLGKCLLPIGVAPVYPGYPSVSPVVPGALAGVALGALALLLWRTRSGWGRPLLFGLGFFYLNLIPVFLFVLFKYSIMIWSMDHLVYLPVIGLIGLATAGLGWLDGHLALPVRAGERLLVATAVVLLAVAAHADAGWYQNSETLWGRTLQRFPNSWLAAQNLAIDYLAQKRFDEAARYARQVLVQRPDLSDAHDTMGYILENTGQPAAALDQYREAERLNPTKKEIYLDLATLLLKSGQIGEAIGQYRQAVKYNPDLAELRYDLGSLLLQTHDLPGAIEQLQAAVQFDPNLAASRENLGSALAQSGRTGEAIEQFAAAIEIDPGYVIAHYNLAFALAQTGHIPNAINQFKTVLQLDPANAKARDSLAKLQLYEMQQVTPK